MNLKSQKGFTLQDLVIAIVVIILFIGIISSSMIAVYRMNLKAKITANATNYAIQIMEYIDKVSYDSVDENFAQVCVQELQIPSRYNVVLEVENYNKDNDKEDLVKKVKLIITYRIEKEVEEEFSIRSLKIREINS